jgi:SAM-dependent methyltransferase
MKSSRRLKEWFDNEALWRSTYPFMFPDSRIAIAPETASKVIKLTGVRGKSVLDLCCGPGRHSVALAARGFSVTGVDRTEFLLKKARARAHAAHLEIEWVRKDMRDFVRPDSFDLALSMFTSFGYFDDRGEDARVLDNVFKSLKRSGAFLMDVYGKETMAKRFLDSSVESLPDGSMLVEKRRLIDDWSRIANEWTIVRQGRVTRFAFNLNIYSGQELRQLFERAGFVDVKLYGSMDGAPYDYNANRLIVVGRKSKKQ